ncbi:MAG: recombinase family protein, partial [Fusobacterium sp.]
MEIIKSRKNVIIYNRVSTIMQDKNESLTEQTDECIRYCNEKGYNIIKILKDVKSGTKDDREGYLELKKHIKRRDFDILVVLETSRIARKMKELVLFFSLLNENNIDYISIREPNYNTTTPDGKFAMNIRLGLIQFERDNTAERVTDRLYFKASKGQWVNGKPPVGYKLVNKKLEIDEEKAEIVKTIYEDFLNGYSLNQINNKFQFSWGSKQVKRILTNPTYKGYIRYGTRSNRKKNNREAFIVKGWHEAIITEDKWEKVQEMYKKLNRKPSETKPTLLGGLLKCKECGNNYIRKRGGSYDKNLYYGCNLNSLILSDKFFYKDTPKCNSANINGELLEKVVIEALKKQINDLNFNDIELEKKRQINIK